MVEALIASRRQYIIGLVRIMYVICSEGGGNPMSLNRLLFTLGIFRTLLAGVITLCGLLFAGTAHAVDCAQWLAVKEWRADLTVSGQGKKIENNTEYVFLSNSSATYKLKVGDVACSNGNRVVYQ